MQTYELSDTDLNAQIARLKASHADTIMIFALPTQTIQAFLAIHKLGWKPRIFLNSVSIDPFVMDVVQRNTGQEARRGSDLEPVPERPDRSGAGQGPRA